MAIDPLLALRERERGRERDGERGRGRGPEEHILPDTSHYSLLAQSDKPVGVFLSRERYEREREAERERQREREREGEVLTNKYSQLLFTPPPK